MWNYKTLAAGNTTLPRPADGGIAIPVWNDELYLEYHRGTYTTQAAEKRNIRDSEEWMLNAEKYSSLAWLAGVAYPQSQLNEAWKKVLFNEFHDLAAGTGIADIYKDSADDFGRVHSMASQATAKSLATLSAYVDTQTAQGTVPVLVFNPMAWKRSDIVEVRVQLPEPSEGIVLRDPQGRAVPMQVLSRTPETHSFDVLVRADDVPSLGYEKFTAAPRPPPAGARPQPTFKVAG